MKALGMNLRNRLIAQNNSLEAIRLSKDKLSFKALLGKKNIPTPKTYFVIRRITDINSVSEFPSDFVLKPNKGFAGRGILLLQRRDDVFWTASRQLLSFRQVRHHIQKILDGEFSSYVERDEVIVEERVYPSRWLTFDNAIGLPDIRIICYATRPVMAMVRYPTMKSEGKANLSAGALGIGVDISTGELERVYSELEQRYYPRDNLGLSTRHLPAWEKILALATRAAKISGLGLAGIDIVIDSKERILVLEINAYPGLEIQNVNLVSLRHYL